MSDLGNKKVFAKNLNHYMSINNVDRNKLCRDLGFNYTTVREWTNGTSYPRIDKIEAIANYFGILKSDLIENKEENQNIKYDDELEQVLFCKFKCLNNNEKKMVIDIMDTIKKGYDNENK